MSLLVLLLLLAQAAPPAERAQRAKQSLLNGDSALAVRLYRELVREMPEDSGLRLNLALSLEAANDYAGELEQLQIITRKKPQFTAAWLLTGLALQKLDRPAEAIAPLKKVVSKEPDNQAALLELADAFLASGAPASAAPLFAALSAKEPQLAKAWQGLGLSYTALSKDAFKKLESEQPRSGEWLMLTAESERERGQPELAFALLHQVDPATPGVHAAIAAVYEKTGHPDWAMAEMLKQPLEKHGANPNQNYLDVLHYRELASQAFRSLAELPESSELHELLAQAKQEQGHRDEALAELRRAAELATGDSRMTGKLAEALVISRMYDEALRLLLPLTTSNPNNAQWQYLLGDALVRERRTEEALPHLEAAVRLNGKLVPARAALGRAYLQLGQPARAIPHLKLGLAADEEAVLFQLGQAYRAAGQAGLAKSTFERQQEVLRRAVPQPPASAPAARITPP